MYKLSLTLLSAILLLFNGYSQKDTLSKNDKAALDSMIKNDEFLKMLDKDKVSRVDVSIGIGNGSFSGDNPAVNATGVTNQVVITPALFYHHKSGLSIGISPFFTKDSSKMVLYQTGLTASYDYYGKEVNTGVSYTRYLSDANKYNNKSLYQNDIFAYLKKAKGLIQPGISIGYASGNYKEVNLVTFIPPPPAPQVPRLVRDSTNNKTSYFSFSASAEHDFSWYNVFDKDDEFDLVPSLIVNTGSDKNTATHTNRLYDRLHKLSNRKKVTENNKFQLQSIAASLDITYTIGKFYLQPNIYVDYYLPSTTAKRLSSIFSVVAGITF